MEIRFSKMFCDTINLKRGSSTVVSVWACELRVPGLIPNIRWPLFFLWYYRRVAKDYPNCCHTVLRRDLQCYMHLRLQQQQPLILNIFKRKRKHTSRHYKKSKNVRQITGKRQVHLSLHKAYWCQLFVIRKKR